MLTFALISKSSGIGIKVIPSDRFFDLSGDSSEESETRVVFGRNIYNLNFHLK